MLHVTWLVLANQSAIFQGKPETCLWHWPTRRLKLLIFEILFQFNFFFIDLFRLSYLNKTLEHTSEEGEVCQFFLKKRAVPGYFFFIFVFSVHLIHKPSKNCQRLFKILATLAKVCQIWSHWVAVTK